MLLNREETKEAIPYCFAKVYAYVYLVFGFDCRNITQRKDETEAVRVYVNALHWYELQVASLLSFILHYGDTSFLLSKIDVVLYCLFSLGYHRAASNLLHRFLL